MRESSRETLAKDLFRAAEAGVSVDEDFSLNLNGEIHRQRSHSNS